MQKYKTPFNLLCEMVYVIGEEKIKKGTEVP